MLVNVKSLSPAAISGVTTDWAPAGLAAADVVRVDLSAAAEITSIDGGVSGRELILQNIDPTFTLVLRHDDGATGTAANRFLLPGAVSLILPPNTGIVLFYDGTSSRWRCESPMTVMQILTESGTTRTLSDSDNNALINYTNAAGCTLTVPTGLVPGHNSAHLQGGAGAVIIAAGGGMTLTAPASATVPIVTAELGATAGVLILTSTTALVNGNLG